MRVEANRRVPHSSRFLREMGILVSLGITWPVGPVKFDLLIRLLNFLGEESHPRGRS